MSQKNYTVYIVRCSDDTLYCGITTDMDRRLQQHNGARAGGARYTSLRNPVKLVYTVVVENRSLASSEEYRIKKLSKTEKLALIGITHDILT